MTEPANLAEMRRLLAPEVAASAAFDGWSETAVRAAAEAKGIDPDAAVYAFEGGAMAMIEAWIDSTNAAMATAWPPERLAPLKIRERIRALVWFRIEAALPVREGLRRAVAIMAMPQNAPRAARIGWRSADAIWHAAGDTATDYNHYTKRLTLSALYASTLAVFLDDKSEGLAETAAFLNRRIDGVMRFEKAKAKWFGRERVGFSPARFFGRLRYPAR